VPQDEGEEERCCRPELRIGRQPDSGPAAPGGAQNNGHASAQSSPLPWSTNDDNEGHGHLARASSNRRALS
jgi:hypothetical protein